MTLDPGKPKKTRLDLYLVENGYFETRQEAQAAIMDGAVLVNNEKSTKPGLSVSTKDAVELRPGFIRQKFVSRGGKKLEKALEEFQINVQDRVCIDVGASTGGFTDCLLQHGASRVYAVDVGYGQLDWKLRNHSRVIVKERVNARYLSPETLYQPGDAKADLAVVDCSFISLAKIIPAVTSCLSIGRNDRRQLICLVKPQFEAGRQAVNKGVVKDKRVHMDVLRQVESFARDNGLVISACTFSPIKGPKGNIEYLALLETGGSARAVGDNLEEVVEKAYASLNSSEEN